MSKKIIVTGGCGYIGSHTVVELINAGYEVISIDNFSNCSPTVLQNLKELTGADIQNFAVDICDIASLWQVFNSIDEVAGIIHFAAYKSVPESMQKPTAYYQNNIMGLANMLEVCDKKQISNFIFSSSCSVYGNSTDLPVTESTPFGLAMSPYAATKQMGEMMVQQAAHINSNFNATILRYFNPAGAHPSLLIGEYNDQKPQSVVPSITYAALRNLPFTIFGTNYPTADGSCVRDVIHVCDLAQAHVQALIHLQNPSTHTCINKIIQTYNVGLGKGESVKKLANLFTEVNQQPLQVVYGEPRPGDVIEIWADNAKIKNELNWQPAYTVADVLQTAWGWDKKNYTA